MSVTPDRSTDATSQGDMAGAADTTLPTAAQYGFTILLVALATLLAFAASQFTPAPGLTLVFVLPVVIAGSLFGWGPSLAAIVAGLLAFDFFFTQPYFSLRIDDPSEIWAALLLLATALIVSAVTWQSRQRAFQARRAAVQAEAVQSLAHAVIERVPRVELARAAAAALHRIFAAPAVVLSAKDGTLSALASRGEVALTAAELAAAESAKVGGSLVPAQTYPHDGSRFDMWPVQAAADCTYVLGVDFGRSEFERPADANRFLEIVGAYLTAGVGQAEP
jgi:K+-sensing histidine kinase KdpD